MTYIQKEKAVALTTIDEVPERYADQPTQSGL